MLCICAKNAKFRVLNLPDTFIAAHLGQRAIVDLTNELLNEGEFGFEEDKGILILNHKEAIQVNLFSMLMDRTYIAYLLCEMMCMFLKESRRLVWSEMPQEGQRRRERAIFGDWHTQQRTKPVNKLATPSSGCRVYSAFGIAPLAPRL